ISDFLDQLTASVSALRTDAVEMALAEGQPPTDVIRIQGKPDTWRAQMYKMLKRDRGIDPARNRRPRKVEAAWDVPQYLDKSEQFQTTANHLERAVRKFDAIMRQRGKQYPALHDLTLTAINDDATEVQAS